MRLYPTTDPCKGVVRPCYQYTVQYTIHCTLAPLMYGFIIRLILYYYWVFFIDFHIYTLTNEYYDFLCPVYLGVVGKEEREPVFSLYWTFHGLGDTIIFFISSSVSLEAHLAILMSLLPVCFCGYIFAEMVYGEHRERISKIKDRLRVKRRNVQGPVETTASVNMVAIELDKQ